MSETEDSLVSVVKQKLSHRKTKNCARVMFHLFARTPPLSFHVAFHFGIRVISPSVTFYVSWFRGFRVLTQPILPFSTVSAGCFHNSVSASVRDCREEIQMLAVAMTVFWWNTLSSQLCHVTLLSSGRWLQQQASTVGEVSSLLCRLS